MSVEVKPGYKQTEVGMIPEDWGVVPLYQTAKRITRGASPRPIDSPKWFDSKSSVGWVRISDVTRSGRYLLETTQSLSEAGVRRSRPVPSGSLIMSICATVGRPIETRIDTCIHDGFVVFDKPTINQSFLYHVLAALEPKWSSRGQTGSQMNLNTGLINGCLIPIPPTEKEQCAIASALTETDAFLEGIDQLIAKKRDIKQATMQQLLTGRKRLPGFSGAWEVRRLGDFGRCLRGVSYNGDSDLLPYDTKETYRLLRSNNVQNSLIDISGLQFVNARCVSSHQVLRENDILICMANGSKELVGKAGLFEVVDEARYTFGAFMGCFRGAPGTNPRFIFYLFSTYKYKNYISNLLAGSSINNLRPADIEQMEYYFPSYGEQSAIAAVLSDMDAELAALEARRDKARQIKQGMMQELLTGRVRLV